MQKSQRETPNWRAISNYSRVEFWTVYIYMLKLYLIFLGVLISVLMYSHLTFCEWILDCLWLFWNDSLRTLIYYVIRRRSQSTAQLGALESPWEATRFVQLSCFGFYDTEYLWKWPCVLLNLVVVDQRLCYLWVSTKFLENSSLSNRRSWMAPCASLVCLWRAALAFVSSSAMTLKRQHKCKVFIQHLW